MNGSEQSRIIGPVQPGGAKAGGIPPQVRVPVPAGGGARVVQRTVTVSAEAAIAVAGGRSVTVQVSSTSPLSPRPLTPAQYKLVTSILAIADIYVSTTTSPEAGLIMGVVFSLLLYEYDRRYPLPGE